MKKNELISMVDFVFRCDNLYPPMNELEVTNTVHEYGKIKNYANFLNQQLNISMFVPAIKVGDKWEVLEMPKFALNRFEGTHTSSTAYWSAKMQYLTVKDNVIFEGCYIDEWGTIKTKWRDLWVDELKDLTIQDLIKYKPTLTKKGLEVSGLNR